MLEPAHLVTLKRVQGPGVGPFFRSLKTLPL